MTVLFFNNAGSGPVVLSSAEGLEMFLRSVALGFQNISSLSLATGLTLPTGSQQASGSACTLSGNLLTVAGTVTGVFATNQIVIGTGIPANTYILGPGHLANTWLLSQNCTTESAETVTAYQQIKVDYAIIRASTANVNWRDDGTAPTSATGFPMLSTDGPMLYASNLLGIQFIAQSGSPTLQVSYYCFSG